MPHAPSPKQWAALSLSDVPEVLFGGAAGGGKSDWLLMDALQYVDQPGYSALLLRRTWSDLNLPGALLDRAHAWLKRPGVPANWNAGLGRYEFQSGAILAFGHLDTENHKYRYQGSELQYVGFDELTQFSESQYSYLASRLRRPQGSSLPLRLRGATNPGGVGHDWVFDRFFTRGGLKHGRMFVSSKLEDNPHVDMAAYEQSLSLLDHITRAQLRHGDWTTRPDGGLFKRDWFRIADHAPQRLQHMVRFWDLAATEEGASVDPDWTVGTRMAHCPDTGRFYVLHQHAMRDTPGEVEKAVRSFAELDGKAVEVLAEQEGGASGKSLMSHYARTVLKGFDFKAERSVTNKVEYARPLSVAAENGLLWLVRGDWCAAFIDECVAFPAVKHDDRVDSASKALQRIQARLRLPLPRIGVSQVAAGPRARP